MNELLRQARKGRGLGWHAAALDMGVPYGTYCDWEMGKHQPSPFYREIVCRYFGKSAEELGIVPKKRRGRRKEIG
jgi:DNA-binding XRE family transcriptional regulator